MNTTVEQPNVIGITQCDSCGSRFKVEKKHIGFIGKSVRCKKCRSLFTLNIEKPTPIEQTSITPPPIPKKVAANQNTNNKVDSTPTPTPDSNATITTPQPKKKYKKRKTSEQVRQEFIDDIADGFRKLHARLSQLNTQEKPREEDVRIWCIDALRNALGYQIEQISTEMRVLGNRVDIALKKDDKVFMILECKTLRAKLNKTVQDQAIGYAAHLHAEWAIVTNGDIWRLYRVKARQGQEPEVQQVFDVSLLDEDGVSDEDAEKLYLLSARAIFKNETASEAHRVACTSEAYLKKAIQSEPVLAEVKKQLQAIYHKENKVKVDLDDETVSEIVGELVDPDEL